MQSKIFIPNFTTKSSGTGLGLAMSKTIVEQAKGKIWFDTVEGVGTTFFVELPILRANGAPGGRSAEGPTLAPLGAEGAGTDSQRQAT
jgi:hypothetical protein